jgi:hypothetical protein
MKSLLIKVISAIVIVFVALVIYIFARGGIDYTSNVSNNADLWGEYKYQRNYVLLRDVFIQKSSQGMAPHGRFVLVPEASFGRHCGRHESSPKTIAEYEKNPRAAAIVKSGEYEFPIDVVGIVRKGTRLRTSRLDKHTGFSWFYGHVETLTPCAEILDGQYAGKKVDITDISYYYQKDGKGIFMYKPEDGVITLAE